MKNGIPVMMLENCCYGKRELMVANMAAKGALGKVVHCEGGATVAFPDFTNGAWTMRERRDCDDFT